MMRLNRKEVKIHIVILLIAMLLEIFVCNVRTFQSVFYQERELSDYPIQLDYGHFLPNGDLVIDGESAFISIVVGGEKIRNVFIDVESEECADLNTENGVCNLKVYIQDELLYGGRTSTRVVTERKILHSVKESNYVFFKSFGETELIQLELMPECGNVVHIHDIKLNVSRPLSFSIIRFLIFIVILELLWLFRPTSFIWQRSALSPGKRGRITALLLYLGFLLIMFILMIKNPLMWQESFNPYAKLAKAITEGKLYVGEADKQIVDLEDKLVSWGPEDERIMFDYALFKGKYYVYFGILPVLILYLPYRLVLGQDMSDSVAMIFFAALLILGWYLLLREIIYRKFKETPFALHILLVVAAVFGSYLPVILSEPTVYSVAIISGVTFTIWGLFFILRALPFFNHPYFLFFGSGCLALVSCCRPTLLIYSLLIIPLAYVSYQEYKKNNVNSQKLTCTAIAVIVPYLSIACMVMCYNCIRFGSPFEFGMVYNLTAVPSKQTAVDVLEMIPIAIYEYLLKMPQFDHIFPFIRGHYEGCVTEYSGTIYYYQTAGYGLLAVNPLLYVLFFVPFVKVEKRKKYYIAVSLVCVVTIFFIILSTCLTQCMATRYTMEYSFFLFLLASVAWFIVWGKVGNQGKKTVKLMMLVGVAIPVFVNLLAFFTTPQYPLNIGNTKWYYRLFYLFQFL